MTINIWISLVLVCIAYRAGAQLYTGITIDYGNTVHYSPTDPSWLVKKPASVSGSIAVLMQSRIAKDLFLRYGISAGSLGYTVKSFPYDSVPGNPFYIYDKWASYGTLYVSGELNVGVRIHVNPERSILIYLGGGVTGYREWSEWGSSGRTPEATFFEYETRRANNNPKGFASLNIETSVGSRTSLGVRYRHHFTNAIEGEFNFPMAMSSGHLSVTQRAVSIFFLLRLT